MKNHCYLVAAVIAGIISSSCASREPVEANAGDTVLAQEKTCVRFATFNASLNRRKAGDLIADLKSGRSSKISQVAEVIQRVRPQVILLNEVDHDVDGEAIRLLCERYLAVSQNGQQPIRYPHIFSAPVNTGVLSNLDMNQDGKSELPVDGFGFGAFPGQYGLAVLSQFPIDREHVRTFQNFLWKDMPGVTPPVNPESGQPFYPADVWNRIRLSSKSHWDVPIRIDDQVVHLICAHPTPPVFDGAEDRNGIRNHDEIRMLADLVSGAGYLYDDQGRRGGLPEGSLFVIAGDMNADPVDGDSTKNAARQLTEHPQINHSRTPSSQGAVEAAIQSGARNNQHRGDPAHDTADFNDARVGNIRVDYCLPGRNLELVDCGVFWPASDQPGYELNQASDHHLVWIDICLK